MCEAQVKETRTTSMNTLHENLTLSGYKVLHQTKKIVREEDFVFLCMKSLL